jgi:hypothetical protein
MMLGRLYLEHLSDGDLAFLGSATESRAGSAPKPEQIEMLIDSPTVYRQLFNQPGRDPLLRGTPFLVFAVLVHRAARDLSQASFVEEWVGPRQRVPVFDVAALRDFGADPLHRLFLAELLASYTHVASGSVLVQTRRGWRRRRFSELDPLRLVELADLVPDHERPWVYRRLGDLSLFLSGIFPDYAAEQLVGEPQRRRLQRALHLRDPQRAEQGDGIWLLEQLGRRAYQMAQRATDGSAGMGDVLARVSQNFPAARRVLNFLTDRYLFPLRRQWFGTG